MMHSRFLKIFAFTFAFLAGAAISRGESVLKADGHVQMSFARMIDEIRGSRLVLIGEDHDRMIDHWRQIKIMKALEDSGVDFSIGLEMFTAGDQAYLDRWVKGDIPEEEFIPQYSRNWNEPWSMYREIFLFGRRHGIPMVGLNIPKEISRKVAAEGFASLTPAERSLIPGSVTCSVDSSYMSLMKRAFAVHNMGDRIFVHFCEAQMLWNRTMSWNIVQYLQRHPDRGMVVIAGKGHAMKPGIPREVLNEREMEITVILPEDSLFTRNNISSADTDYLILQ